MILYYICDKYLWLSYVVYGGDYVELCSYYVGHSLTLYYTPDTMPCAIEVHLIENIIILL